MPNAIATLIQDARATLDDLGGSEPSAVEASGVLISLLRHAVFIEVPNNGVIVGPRTKLPDVDTFALPAPVVALYAAEGESDCPVRETLTIAWVNQFPDANFLDNDESGFYFASLVRAAAPNNTGVFPSLGVMFTPSADHSKKPGEMQAVPGTMTALRQEMYEHLGRREGHDAILGILYGSLVNSLSTLYHVSAALKRNIATLAATSEQVEGRAQIHRR